MNPLNDISSIYLEEVMKPQIGKSQSKPIGGKVKKGETSEEASAKRVRQAVYDIRYRARREDVPLEQAFNQYSGKSGMTGPEKAAVKDKLGLGSGPAQSNEEYIKEEQRDKKYKVRVKDKTSGKSYVRYATREKINSLRSNPNISSVEMTGYGEPYEGERKKGNQTAKAKSGKGLDPVGKEDGDVNNDGKRDKTDKYLMNRRKAIGKAMAKEEYVDEIHKPAHGEVEVPDKNLKKLVSKAVKRIDADVDGDVDTNDPKSTEMGEFVPTPDGKGKLKTKIQRESYYNWREDLREVVDGEDKQIKEKKIKNKIIINPSLKEAIESLGGELLDVFEVNEIDYVIEEVYTELIQEGFSEDDVEYGIETALTTLDEGYYDSAVAASKAAAEKNKGEAPKKSLKDRVKSAAKKAIYGTARAVGKVAKAKAAAQAAPEKAKEKVQSYTDRIKKLAKSGYKSGRGPVDKKTTYRGAGVGRKEKIGEEIELQEKSTSVAQQQAAGAALAAKRGETDPATLKGASLQMYKSMSEKELRDFAKTKHEGLPEKKEVEEAVTQMPGRENNPPSGTTAKQDDVQRKQMLANKQKMLQKKMMLQRQQLQMQKQGRLPMGSTTEEVELDERTRYAKETGKDPQTGKPSEKGGSLGGDDRHSKVMRHMQKDLRKTGGLMSSRGKPIKPQGKKQEKGAKSYQGRTPVDRIKAQLAKKRAPKPDIGSRFD